MKLQIVVAVAAIAITAMPAQARSRHHSAAHQIMTNDGKYQILRTNSRHAFRGRHHHRSRARRAARVHGVRSTVALINYKLARYVHRTGKCGSASEQLATYYWEGQQLASGGRFIPMGLTAAHRTLPFGTKLEVTNPKNGRSVNVTINDRGPYTNADIDLSLGAAKAIGMDTSIYVCVSR